MPAGMISFVGAGPGMGEELTLAARERLQQAEVIVYDALVSPFVLLHASPFAVIYPMGKRGGRTNPTQEEINELLIARALEGKRVVRLKGGDPTIFGRLKEEIRAAREHGIPYEIVPGVTAATLVASRLGISLTDRDRSSSVTFLTGHRRAQGKAPELDWEAASRSGTIVVYMGVLEAEKNVSRLLDAGVPPQTPVAVVRWAGTPREEVLRTTLKDLPGRIKEIHPPALWIVGEIVEEMEYERKEPWTIVGFFRPRWDEEWEKPLRERGFLPFPCPLEERVPHPELLQRLFELARELPQKPSLAFTSPGAVEIFFEAWCCTYDLRDLKGLKLFALGEGTGKALRRFGVIPDRTGKGNRGVEDLLELLQDLPPHPLWIFQGEGGRKEPFRALEERGYALKRVLTHRLKPRIFPEALRHALRGGWIRMAVWTSPSQVKLALSPPHLELWKGVHMIAMGRETEKALHSLGFSARVAEESSLPGVMKALLEERGQLTPPREVVLP